MSYVEGKTKNQILNDIYGTAQPGSLVLEQQKMGIIVRCTEDIEKALKSLDTSMNNNATSSDKLAKKVFYLDIILTVATILGTAIAIIKLFN